MVGLLEEGFLLSRIVGADRGTGERERERVVRTRRGGGGGGCMRVFFADELGV